MRTLLAVLATSMLLLSTGAAGEQPPPRRPAKTTPGVGGRAASPRGASGSTKARAPAAGGAQRGAGSNARSTKVVTDLQRQQHDDQQRTVDNLKD